MMKALLINGSPHEHGCTYTALAELAKTLEAEGIETEIVQAGKTNISCNACGVCKAYKALRSGMLPIFSSAQSAIVSVTGRPQTALPCARPPPALMC